MPSCVCTQTRVAARAPRCGGRRLRRGRRLRTRAARPRLMLAWHFESCSIFAALFSINRSIGCADDPDQHISADDPAARHTTQRAAVVECKAAPGTQDSGKRPLLFFALAGRVPLFSCRQANVPTNMRRKESEKRHRVRSEDDRKRALRLLLCQSRCCNRLKRDAEAVCTHWVAQRMTTAASSSCS